MTRFDCEKIQSLTFPVVKSCDVIHNGSLRLSTCFYYPDTSQIDVFVDGPKGLFGSVKVSDLGQTTDMLLQIAMPPYGTKKRKQLVHEICDSLGVVFSEGTIQVELSPADTTNLPEAILRVAQACVRISGLYMTKRLYSASGYREAIEEFFSERELQFETDLIVPSSLRDDLKIDFRITGRSRNSLVQTLATGNSQYAHSMCNEAFVKWHDIEPVYRDAHQLVTVVDSSTEFRKEDIIRLHEYSTVIAFPAEADDLAKTLAA